MPHQKLTEPCAINNCTSSAKSFRNVTQDFKNKINKYFDLEYNYLKVNEDQICFEHYMTIVNFVASKISENLKSKFFIDLGDIIKTSNIFSNYSNISNDYLKFYEEN
ncbi:1563_t:CDS:1 [Racocetra fulgida]|uniref:1563_t:CDS:1 n=1 Tax=Racocetra fulgida TaxID=60492 RepID=A0A9N9DEI4_9GLOM|nr:1563_t:CDS:1 [Racocetra fulgida]